MAEQLNMNGLSLKDSQHAPQANGQGNGFGERSAYIPPHMRQRGPPPAAAPAAAAAAGGPDDFDGGAVPAPNGAGFGHRG